MLFLAPIIGSRSLIEHVKLLCGSSSQNPLPKLSQIIFFGDSPADVSFKHQSYDEFAAVTGDTPSQLPQCESPIEAVQPSDILSFQLTSGE